MRSSLKDILLIDIDIADKLEHILNTIFFELILVVFFISLILVLIRNENINDLSQRLFFSILLVFSFSDIYTSAIDSIFPFCDEIIQKFSGRKSILNLLHSFEQKSINVSNKGLFDKIWGYFKVFGDPDRVIELFFAILCYVVLVLTSLFYTFGYYFGYIFIGIIALIGIFPININVLTISIKSLLWSSLVPIICAAILALLGQELSFNSEGLLDSALSVIKLFLVSLTLFLSLPMAYAFINGKTAASVISNFSSRLGTGIATTGIGFAGGYLLMANKSALGLATRPIKGFSNSMKEFSQNRANFIKDQYKIPDKNELKPISPIKYLKENINSSVKSGEPIYSSILNPKNIHKSMMDSRSAISENIKSSPSLKVIKSEFKNNPPLRASLNSIENISILKGNKLLRPKENIPHKLVRNTQRRPLNGRNKRNFSKIPKGDKSNKPNNF
jgi:hypothetical protein